MTVVINQPKKKEMDGQNVQTKLQVSSRSCRAPQYVNISFPDLIPVCPQKSSAKWENNPTLKQP